MPPAADQQAAQTAILAGVAPPVDAAWQQLDVSNLKDSLPTFILQMQAVAHRYGMASSALTANAYTDARRTAGIPGKFTVKPGELPDHAAVEKSIRWATRGLWSETPDVETARTNVAGVMDRLVLDVGRDTLTGAVQADRKAKGWARVPEPGCCSFCALLATRGAVYRSQQTASFLSHDHCRCVPEPIFNEYEPTAQIRQWQSLYQQAKRTAKGPKATRLAFRQLVEQ